MSSGIASTAIDIIMHPYKDGSSIAATDSAQDYREDDRGGKWARDQGHRGKGRNSGRGGGSGYQAETSSRKKIQKWNYGSDWSGQEKVIADLKRQKQAL